MPTRLLLEEDVIHVHEDYDMWAGLRVGYNDEKMIVIELTYRLYGEDYDIRDENWEKRMIIDQRGIDTLGDRLRCTLLQLPETIKKKFGTEGEWPNVADVMEAYDDIRYYLEYHKIHYRYEKELHTQKKGI